MGIDPDFPWGPPVMAGSIGFRIIRISRTFFAFFQLSGMEPVMQHTPYMRNGMELVIPDTSRLLLLSMVVNGLDRRIMSNMTLLGLLKNI